MKFLLTAEHRHFFLKEHWVEFEELLEPPLLEALVKDIGQTTESHDLWRRYPAVKKVALNRGFAAITSELIDIRPLRLGMDMLFSRKSRSAAFETEQTLQHISSIQGVICGLMLCITAPQAEVELAPLFPRTPGNGIFFESTLPFTYPYTQQAGSYLLITYTERRAVYVMSQEEGSWSPYWRALGYSSGDRLSDKLNPIIYR